MPRPRQLPTRPDLTMTEIGAASYEGSPEHKTKRWWGGLPQAYFDKKTGIAYRPGKLLTTICPMLTISERDQATLWVRAALRGYQYRYYEGCGKYPKHLWYREDSGQYWFGFGINQTSGTYKGWPITEDEKREVFG